MITKYYKLDKDTLLVEIIDIINIYKIKNVSISNWYEKEISKEDFDRLYQKKIS